MGHMMQEGFALAFTSADEGSISTLPICSCLAACMP